MSTTIFEKFFFGVTKALAGDFGPVSLFFDTGKLSKPTGAAAVAASGGSLAADTYQVQIATLDTRGTPTDATTAIPVTALLNDKITVTWANQAKNAGYRVYITNGSAAVFSQDVAANVVTLVISDTGTMSALAVVPLTNLSIGLNLDIGGLQGFKAVTETDKVELKYDQAGTKPVGYGITGIQGKATGSLAHASISTLSAILPTFEVDNDTTPALYGVTAPIGYNYMTGNVQWTAKRLNSGVITTNWWEMISFIGHVSSELDQAMGNAQSLLPIEILAVANEAKLINGVPAIFWSENPA